jgi:hypothetical protein
MAVVIGVLNGTNLNRDEQFQSQVSTILSKGVRKNFDNELEVTTNQVDTGVAFLEVVRDSVTPSETFVVPVRVTSPVVVNTSGTGWVILRADKAKVLDGSGNSPDGTGVAVVEDVTVLPTTDPYIILATLAAGVITDARTWAQISENVIQDPIYYDEDTGVANAYAVTIVGVKEYVDGAEYAVKATNANTGASTLNVNSLGAKAIKKKTNVDLIAGDIPAGGMFTCRYDADNDWMQMISAPATIASLAKATQAQAEAGTDDSAYMTPLKTRQAIDVDRIITADAGENVDGTTTPQAVHISNGAGGRTAGDYYKSDSNNTTNKGQKFEGFAIGNVTTGNPGEIITSGIVGGFTGLSIGEEYYLDETPGAITLNRTGVKVGVAITATQILIVKDDKNFNHRLATVGSFFHNGGPITEQVLTSFTVPGGLLGAKNEIYIKALIGGIVVNSNKTVTFRLKYGATVVATSAVTWASGGTNYSGELVASLIGDGTTAAQRGTIKQLIVQDGVVTGPYTSIDVSTGTGSEDSTGDLTLTLTVQINSTANFNATFYNIVAQAIRGL